MPLSPSAQTNLLAAIASREPTWLLTKRGQRSRRVNGPLRDLLSVIELLKQGWWIRVPAARRRRKRAA